MYLHFICIARSDKSLKVTVTSDLSVNNTLCEGETVTLKCQVSDVANPSYKWSSNKFNISEETNSIMITATTISIEYHCIVFDATTNRSGDGSIVIPNSGKLIVSQIRVY